MTLFGGAANRHYLCYTGFDGFDSEPDVNAPGARLGRLMRPVASALLACA
ncbi:MAG: hypothetical protein RLY71_2094 [Pseudomonadota bacterium]|jgi:FdhD protein